jgi:hypothetical protein
MDQLNSVSDITHLVSFLNHSRFTLDMLTETRQDYRGLLHNTPTLLSVTTENMKRNISQNLKNRRIINQ